MEDDAAPEDADSFSDGGSEDDSSDGSDQGDFVKRAAICPGPGDSTKVQQVVAA